MNETDRHDTVRRIVERFGLEPHPEGGYFKEVYRSPLAVPHTGVPADREQTRRAGTLIYFLLERDDFSAWHRVRWTDEIWHVYAGGPIELHTLDADGTHRKRLVTTDVLAGQPTAVVPAGTWQAARPGPGAGWAFGGCTVSPGFEFADFQMPARDALRGLFPAQAALIDALTRL